MPPSVRTGRGGAWAWPTVAEPMVNTYIPGSPAYLEGHRVGALSRARKHGVPPGRDATKPLGSEGRFGGQMTSGENRMVAFERDLPTRDGGRGSRWDAAGPSGKGGHGNSGRHRGGSAGYGRHGGGLSRGGPGH